LATIVDVQNVHYTNDLCIIFTTCHWLLGASTPHIYGLYPWTPPGDFHLQTPNLPTSGQNPVGAHVAGPGDTDLGDATAVRSYRSDYFSERHQRRERLEVRAVVIVVFDSERWEDSRVGDNSNAVDVVFRSRRCGHCLYDTCGLSKRHWCLLYWSCRNLDVAGCRRLGFRIRKSYWKVFRIGTVRYNWPMSAHASQAFSIAHCTDSEDLPSYCLGRPTMVGRPSVLPVVLF